MLIHRESHPDLPRRPPDRSARRARGRRGHLALDGYPPRGRRLSLPGGAGRRCLAGAVEEGDRGNCRHSVLPRRGRRLRRAHSPRGLRAPVAIRTLSVVLDTGVLIDHLRASPAATEYLSGLDERPSCSEISRIEVLQGLRSAERRAADRLFVLIAWVPVSEAVA